MGKGKQKYFLFLLSIILLAGSVFAESESISGQPHQLYGTVLVDGIPVPDGTAVQASVGEDVYVTTTSGGKFGYAPFVFQVGDPDWDREGKNIEIFVNYKKVQDLSFENGGYDLLGLQITTTCGDGFCLGSETTSSCPGACPGAPAPSPGPGGTGGSGGDGGGGGSGGSTIKTSSEVCIEQWECSDWSDCKEGKQKRLCRDNSACKTEKLKPSETRECTADAFNTNQSEIQKEIKQSDVRAGILGAVIGAVGGVKIFGSLIFIVLVLVGGLVVVFVRKKNLGAKVS